MAQIFEKYETAVVTGASSGIGREIARFLLEKGLSVAALGRSGEKLKTLKEETTQTPGTIFPYEMDLKNEKGVTDVFRQIVLDLKGIDVLINNAGLGHKSSLIDGDVDQWREMLDVNVLGLSVCTKEAVRNMKERNFPGYIIHMNSLSGHRIYKEGGMYAASKFAVSALTESLRRELQQMKSSIRISQISLGLVSTEFHKKYYKDKNIATQIYQQFNPLTGEDVTQVVAYLLSQPLNVQVHDILVRPLGQEG